MCLSRPSWPFPGYCPRHLSIFILPSACDYWVTNDNYNNQSLIDYSLLRHLWLCFQPTLSRPFRTSPSGILCYFGSVFSLFSFSYLVIPRQPTPLSMHIAHRTMWACLLVYTCCLAIMSLVIFDGPYMMSSSNPPLYHLDHIFTF